jgi:hypothetical protein
MKTIFTIALLFITSLAFAEVSDKMPSISRIWVEGMIIGFVGFFLARFRIWTGAIFFIFTLFFCIGTYGLISDPFVGKAIIAEQGVPYIVAVCGSIILMVAPLLIGLFLRHKKAKLIKKQSTT